MDKKFLAFALAAMFAVSAFAIVVDSEDSDATSAGTMNIYVYNGSSWTEYTNLSGYNALKALQSSSATFTGATIDGYLSTDYVIQKSNDWGSYDEINSNYGDLLTVNGVTETSTMVWNTFYYDGSDWQVGPAAIGFIVPFTDGAIASANVALYYGEVTTDIPGDLYEIDNLAQMIDPVASGYEYTFYVKVSASGATPDVKTNTLVTYKDSNGAWVNKTLTSEDVLNGITIRGYGSNAYSALKNALNSADDNVVGTETYGPYFGWISSIFGLSTVTGVNYTYWIQNTASDNYLAFNLGAYSGLDNVPSDGYVMQESAFKLVYDTYVYS